MSKTVIEIILIAVLFISIAALKSYLVIPLNNYLLILGVTALISFGIWIFVKFKNRNGTYIDERGYVYLVKENDLEHRFIAKMILNRDLEPNEIVHHINGNKIDNHVRNLCLMDHEKHELFHSWLTWKKKKNGRYPRFKDQKRILAQEYDGILLEQVIIEKSYQKSALFHKENINTEETQFTTAKTVDPHIAKNLFEELRKERLKIAHKENLPAYEIFYDKTLNLMVRAMPEDDLSMLKLVGPTKYQKYGPAFLGVIKKFKSDLKH